MKLLKYVIATIIFVIACPLSWVAAWNAGSWLTVVFSLVLPTYGIFYWVLFDLINVTFLHALVSFVLGIVGAGITLTVLHTLTKGDG